jgi:DNA-binding CsgD family transcriptional regulator
LKREWWLYGLMTGILLLILQIVEYKAIVRDIKLEMFGGLIALIFLLVGVGVSWLLIRQKHRPAQEANLGGIEGYGLSEREREVLELLSQGLSNQEIADHLFVSLNTIKTHLSKIYQKMNVTSRTQALKKAHERPNN